MCDKKTLKAENEALRQRVADLEKLVADLAAKVDRPTVINIPAPNYPSPVYPVYPNDQWYRPRWYCSSAVAATSANGTAVTVNTSPDNPAPDLVRTLVNEARKRGGAQAVFRN